MLCIFARRCYTTSIKRDVEASLLKVRKVKVLSRWVCLPHSLSKESKGTLALSMFTSFT